LLKSESVASQASEHRQGGNKYSVRYFACVKLCRQPRGRHSSATEVQEDKRPSYVLAAYLHGCRPLSNSRHEAKRNAMNEQNRKLSFSNISGVAGAPSHFKTKYPAPEIRFLRFHQGRDSPRHRSPSRVDDEISQLYLRSTQGNHEMRSAAATAPQLFVENSKLSDRAALLLSSILPPKRKRRRPGFTSTARQSCC